MLNQLSDLMTTIKIHPEITFAWLNHHLMVNDENGKSKKEEGKRIQLKES